MARQNRTLLEEAVRELEHVVTSPVVPGDVGPWTDSVRSQLAKTLVMLESNDRASGDAYAAIVESSPGLSNRVKVLRADYDRIFAELTDIRDRLASLGERAADTTDSDEPIQDLEEARDALLRGITGLRGFEASLRTWLLEAVQRENGVGD